MKRIIFLSVGMMLLLSNCVTWVGRVPETLFSVMRGSVKPKDINFKKELFVNNAAVLKTLESSPSGNFRSVMARLANGKNVDSFVEDWIKAGWDAGSPFADAATAAALRDAWNRRAGLDFELIGVVNRLDLTRFPGNDVRQTPSELGESRLVYQIKGLTGRAAFSFILEYKLASTTAFDKGLSEWAERWHNLARIGGPSEFPAAYVAALDNLILSYTTPSNGKASLGQLRTNDFVAAQTWNLREFTMPGGKLRPHPTALTPGNVHDNSADLARFITNNSAKLENGTFLPFPSDPVIKEGLRSDEPFGFKWTAAVAPEHQNARFIYSFNTCNGCHNGDTGTLFQHVGVLSPNLSDFLTKEIKVEGTLPKETAQKHNEVFIRQTMMAGFLNRRRALDSIGKLPGIDLAMDLLNDIVINRASHVH